MISKEKLIESNDKLYFDIDQCIDEIISARLNHDQEKEGRALFRMEGLLVGTQQQLTYINNYLEKINLKIDDESSE